MSALFALWSLQHRVLTENLQAGMNVEVDDLCTATLSISAKMETATSPLPADAQLYVALRPDVLLNEAVRMGATISRVEPGNMAPQLVQVSALVGALNALKTDAVVQIEGYRQGFDPARDDEGVFFLPPDGAPALRATNYITQGDRELIFALPALPSAMEFNLEVRTRTKGAKPTGPLYTGSWNGVVRSA